MKIGVRKPSIKKSISAKTTGKMNRSIKKGINPSYGKKGVGYIKNPKKAMYNHIYNKTTVGMGGLNVGGNVSSNRKNNKYSGSYSSSYVKNEASEKGLIEKKINNKKKLRMWFNIIGYFILVPTIFNILVDFSGFIRAISYEPEIILPMILTLAPFIFLVYKANKFKYEIKELKANLEDIKVNITDNCSIVDDFDEKVTISKEEIININSDDVALIGKIVESNNELLDNISEIINLVKENKFNIIKGKKDILIFEIRKIIMCTEKLIDLNNNDEIQINLNEILFEMKTIIVNTKLLLINGEIISLDYENGISSDFDSIMRNIKSMLESGDIINKNMKDIIKFYEGL